MGEKVTAKLSNVRLERVVYSSGYALIATGFVYEDSRGFKDGEFLRTSVIKKIDNGKIYTLHSIYEVI
jgi:hypothetical protein